jgi:Flp pilus assembly protein TadD
MSSSAAADKKTTQSLPASAAELVTEAKRLFAAHRLKDAEEKYLQVLKLAPDNIFVLGNLATIQIELENYVEAEKNLRKAMSLDPKDAFSQGVWGNLLFRAAKYDEAFQVLSRAAELDPNSAEIQNLLGITLSHKGQRGAAETALRKALQLDPNYGNAHNNLAVIYITQDPPLTELARWHYQKAILLHVNTNAELEKLLYPGPAEKKK